MKKIFILFFVLLSFFGKAQFVGGGTSRGGVTEATVASMIGDSLDAVVSGATLTYSKISIDSIATVLHDRVDSLALVIINIINNSGSDLTSPTIDSIEIGRYNDSTFVLFASELLETDSIPVLSAFNITEDGNAYGLDTIYVQTDSILLVGDSIGLYNTTYLVDYTSGNVQDTAGNKMASFSNHAVSNYITEPTTNMVSNGTFSDASFWSIGAHWTISGGVATFDDVDSDNLSQTAANMISPVLINVAYTLELDISGATGNVVFSVSNSDYSVVYVVSNIYTNGHQTINFTAPANVGIGGIAIRGSASQSESTFIIDNVSLIAQ